MGHQTCEGKCRAKVAETEITGTGKAPHLERRDSLCLLNTAMRLLVTVAGKPQSLDVSKKKKGEVGKGTDCRSG